jgi:hypothetical protein
MKSMIYRDLLLFIKMSYKIIIIIIILLVLKTIFNYSDFIDATGYINDSNTLSQNNIIDLTPSIYTKELFFERSLGLTYNIDGIIEIIYMCLIISLYIYKASKNYLKIAVTLFSQYRYYLGRKTALCFIYIIYTTITVKNCQVCIYPLVFF